MEAYDGVFIVRHDYELEIVKRQLSEMNESGDNLLVITKSQEGEIDIGGAIVIRDVCPNKEYAIYLDHASNVCRHGFAEDVVPDCLDDGTKEYQEDKQAKKDEKKEPLVCECCQAIMVAGKCGSCGHEIKRKKRELEVVAGELQEVKEIDQAFYSGLLYHARQKGYADGWAKHKYREKFGVFPTGAKQEPMPDVRVAGYIKHLNIKRAKSEKKNKAYGDQVLKSLLEKFDV